jgi:predicted DCC family thiol-disulfide oxidoreductase YuxK
MIFQNAKTTHFGIARVIVFGILLTDLLLDDHTSTVSFPREAFLEHGLLRLVPEPCWEMLFSSSGMSVFSILYGLVLFCGLLGVGMGYFTTITAIAFTVMFHGIARGFGGHVNHQELICLHALFFFLPKMAYHNFSIIRNHKCKPEYDPESDETARFLLRSLTFWIFLTYFFIGLARLQSSDLRVYSTDAMTLYAVTHSVKWNYWDFSMAKNLLNEPILRSALQISFPLATILEIAAPLALFCRKMTVLILVSLIMFHISILLFMNIFFWQNLLLFTIPLMGWWIDRKTILPSQKSDGIIVFYDADCGFCDGFVRHLAKVDTLDLLRFAPLESTTAAALALTPRGERKTWTIKAHVSGNTLERSDAVVKILQSTPFWAEFADLIEIIPRVIRDMAYRVFARLRYVISLKTNACDLPDKAFLSRLLP